MSTPVAGGKADIVRLTRLAGEAAREGRWDEVIQCYSERGALLESIHDMPLPIEELLKMDGELRDRIQTAQAVLEDLLAGAQMTKRQVQGLRQLLAVPPYQPETLSREA